MYKLETIMDKQASLQERLGTDFSAMSYRDKAAFMKAHFVYLDQELQEALYEMPFFKDWKDYSSMSDEDIEKAWAKVRMELIDALHFFVNLLLCSGMSANDVYNMYLAKNKENNRRQDAGYTADVSYRDQSVEEVMSNGGAIDGAAEAELQEGEAVLPADKPSCTVVIGNEIHCSEAFVATLFDDPNGRASSHFSGNILQLGFAAKFAKEAYERELAKYSEETQEEIAAAVGGYNE